MWAVVITLSLSSPLMSLSISHFQFFFSETNWPVWNPTSDETLSRGILLKFTFVGADLKFNMADWTSNVLWLAEISTSQ